MDLNFKDITTIGFDADDTLWVNETYFREAEEAFTALLEPYETKNTIDQELFRMEMRTLELYGYGIMGFMLSMIESALELYNGRVSQKTIAQILDLGKKMISHKLELLDGVEEVLETLSKKYRLLVLTKGDLLDQERKLKNSGLIDYFHHVEVLSDKKASNYKRLLEHLEVETSEFLMVGNSLKSDVLPILELGARAIHVPFHTTWVHEEVQPEEHTNSHLTISGLRDLLTHLN
ncbi:MAG: HAD family hydrolase [Robiginitalea sp.]|uniref:HAD family hydrolase n=1 Tax=Robiginitalea sp. TaxID=1902411 RepID=UPI003C741CEA